MGGPKFRSLGETTLPHVYRPVAQEYGGGVMAIAIETVSGPGSMVESVRKTLVASSPALRHE